MPAERRPKKLLDQVRGVVYLKYYSHRVEQTYVQWLRCYILFDDRIDAIQAKPSHKLPAVLTAEKVRAVIRHMLGIHHFKLAEAIFQGLGFV